MLFWYSEIKKHSEKVEEGFLFRYFNKQANKQNLILSINYKRQQIKNMKSYTPLKSSLISLEATPQKQVVGYQINSWMQTNDKKRRPSAFRNPSIKIIEVSPKNRSSLATLRQKRLDLLIKSTKKCQQKLVPISIINTNSQKQSPATAATQSPEVFQSMTPLLASSVEIGSKKTKIKEISPPIIEVSEFTAEQKQENEKLNNTKKLLQSLFRGKSGLRVRKMSAEIKNNIVLQAKVTQNHYKKMSFMTKKLTKVN